MKFPNLLRSFYRISNPASKARTLTKSSLQRYTGLFLQNISPSGTMIGNVIYHLMVSGGIMLVEKAVTVSFRYLARRFRSSQRAGCLRNVRRTTRFMKQTRRSKLQPNVPKSDTLVHCSSIARADETPRPDSRSDDFPTINSSMLATEGSNQLIQDDLNGMQVNPRAPILELNGSQTFNKEYASEIYTDATHSQLEYISNSDFESVTIEYVREQQYIQQYVEEPVSSPRHEESILRPWESTTGEQLLFDGEIASATSPRDSERRLCEGPRVNCCLNAATSNEQPIPSTSYAVGYANDASTINTAHDETKSVTQPTKRQERQTQRKCVAKKRGKRNTSGVPKKINLLKDGISKPNNSNMVASSEGVDPKNDSNFGVASTSSGTRKNSKYFLRERKGHGSENPSGSFDRAGCSKSNTAKKTLAATRKGAIVCDEGDPSCSNSSRGEPGQAGIVTAKGPKRVKH